MKEILEGTTMFNWFMIALAAVLALFITKWAFAVRLSMDNYATTTGSRLPFVFGVANFYHERGYIFSIRPIMTETYLRLKDENAEMKERLALTEGDYFLPNAKRMSEEYEQLQRDYQKEVATVNGLTRELHLCDALIARYELMLGLDPDAHKRLRNDRSGQFVARECKADRVQSKPEPKYIDLPEDDCPYSDPTKEYWEMDEIEDIEELEELEELEEQEPRQGKVIAINQPEVENKHIKAYKMSLGGAKPSTIAEMLNISTESAKRYIRLGKQELAEQKEVVVNTHGTHYKHIDGATWEEMKKAR